MKKEYWKEPLIQEGRTLSWEEAIAQFRDLTGRPGPATWRLGTYPEEQHHFPVQGISWYEAAAYAVFTGKSLPTVYHWYNAAGLGYFSHILLISNFGGKGPAPVGHYQGLAQHGAFDMAGNVKEWCWNQTGDRRYILGGAWNEPDYMFSTPDAQSPFHRRETYGFRCVKYDVPVSRKLIEPVDRLAPDLSQIKPVDDKTFEFYRNLYAYDPGELNARINSADESVEHWRHEAVSVNAAYGNERLPIHLYLPKNAAPPYQAVIYFPGVGVLLANWEAPTLPEMSHNDFIPRSGRVLVYPIYKGTFARRSSSPLGRVARRDRIIQWAKDVGRVVDYLETRKDIDSQSLAFYGFSMGAVIAPIMNAIEPRLKAAVWYAGGLIYEDRGYAMGRAVPEVDSMHFAPRVTIPVLMVNGRSDFRFPLETSQIPLFKLIGSHEKRHAILEGGHAPVSRDEAIKEMLDWLDRHLGPARVK